MKPSNAPCSVTHAWCNDELSWIFVGDELQGQLPGHWRGVKTKNNLWKSDLLPPAMIELTVQHRSKDPVLNAFWKRARDESSAAEPDAAGRRNLQSCWPL